MAFNVTVTPQVQEVEVSATVQPYEVEIKVNDGGLKLTTNGDSGEATYDAFSGDLNIPNYSLSGLGGVPTSRTLTINGTAYDLSANRSWTIPTHDAVTIGTANGLSLAGQVLSLGLASSGVTGALSGTDWSTFNGKQNALGFTPVSESGSYANPLWITSLGWNKISSTPTTLSGYGITNAYTSGQIDTLLNAKQNNLSLTTSGSSGASTLVGSTLNIPNYTLSGLGGIGGSIASGQVAFGSGTNTIGGSNNLFWDSANGRLGIGTNSPSSRFEIAGVTSGNAFKVNGGAGGFTSQFVSINEFGSLTVTGILTDSNNLLFGGVGTSGAFARVVFGFLLDKPYFGFGSGTATRDIYFYRDSADLIIGTTTSNTPRFRLFGNTGNLLLQNGGTFTDAGFRLDVNGTARIQGNLTTNISAGQVMFAGTSGLLSGSNNLFWDNSNGRLGVNRVNPSFPLDVVGQSRFSTNINLGTTDNTGGVRIVFNNSSSGRNFQIANNWNVGNVLEITPSTTVNGTTFTTPAIAINGSSSNILIGTTTDSGFRLDVNGTARVQGDLTISDTRNIILATSTGTKIGTATSQKLSLWNATPNVQPTTAITAAAFVANTSGIVDDTATFGGYTIGQIVAALKRLGALA